MQKFLCLLLCLGCSALRAGERLDIMTGTVTQSQGSCSTCSELVHFHKHASISWEIFPPMPTPGLDLAITCIPSRKKRWGPSASDQVEQVLDAEDCGLGDGADGLSKKEKKDCKGLYAKQNKRASFLGVPVAFLQQLAVCGRCTVCEAFAKVKDLWKKLKKAASKVVSKLKQAKQYLFGFSYAPEEVREGMKQRFDTYFPPTPGHASTESSALETAQTGSDEEDHEQMLHDALMKHLEGKSPELIQEHLSLLEQRLKEADIQEDDQLDAAKKEFHGRAAEARRSLEEELPTLLGNKECQQLVASSLVSQVLTITLYAELPNIVNAALSLVMGNIHGALHSLIPKIYLHAAPHLGGDVSTVTIDNCLKAMRQQRKPLLDACTHEQPLLSCTARTFQRLMEGALSQQWWPLRHNEKGTTSGSINLGYKYDDLMTSLQCSTKGSCLEQSLSKLENQELKVSELEQASKDELTNLEELQCAFAGSRIDTEDGKRGKLPVFTDKIWAAGLKAHGWSLEHSDVAYNEACPSMVPFAVAFCAEDLKCMDADTAGQGLLKPVEFDEVLATASKKVSELANISLDSDRENGLARLESFWAEMAQSNFWGLSSEEDALQWNLLWKAANITSKVGVLSDWPTILDALEGKNKTYVDWKLTMDYWQKVLFHAFVRMRVRSIERTEVGEKASNERALADVMATLRSIFDTKFCSPGALGGLKDEDLMRLGTSWDTVAVMSTFIHDKSTVVRMWKQWMVFNIKLRSNAERDIVTSFKEAIKTASCTCMCYDSCGKKEASAFVHCNAGLEEKPATEFPKETLLSTLYADTVVVDRVYAVGAHYEDAVLRIVQVHRPGSCGFRIDMTGREIRRGKKGKERVTLSALVSDCNVPDFFALSPGEDIRVTAWAPAPHTNLKATWDWFLEVNQEVDDYDADTWSDSDQANFQDDEIKMSDDDSIDAFDEEEY